MTSAAVVVVAVVVAAAGLRLADGIKMVPVSNATCLALETLRTTPGVCTAGGEELTLSLSNSIVKVAGAPGSTALCLWNGTASNISSIPGVLPPDGECGTAGWTSEVLPHNSTAVYYRGTNAWKLWVAGNFNSSIYLDTSPLAPPPPPPSLSPPSPPPPPTRCLLSSDLKLGPEWDSVSFQLKYDGTTLHVIIDSKMTFWFGVGLGGSPTAVGGRRMDGAVATLVRGVFQSELYYLTSLGLGRQFQASLGFPSPHQVAVQYDRPSPYNEPVIIACGGCVGGTPTTDTSVPHGPADRLFVTDPPWGDCPSLTPAPTPQPTPAPTPSPTTASPPPSDDGPLLPLWQIIVLVVVLLLCCVVITAILLKGRGKGGAKKGKEDQQPSKDRELAEPLLERPDDGDKGNPVAAGGEAVPPGLEMEEVQLRGEDHSAAGSAANEVELSSVDDDTESDSASPAGFTNPQQPDTLDLTSLEPKDLPTGGPQVLTSNDTGPDAILRQTAPGTLPATRLETLLFESRQEVNPREDPSMLYLRSDVQARGTALATVAAENRKLERELEELQARVKAAREAKRLPL